MIFLFLVENAVSSMDYTSTHKTYTQVVIIVHDTDVHEYK